MMTLATRWITLVGENGQSLRSWEERFAGTRMHILASAEDSARLGGYDVIRSETDVETVRVYVKGNSVIQYGFADFAAVLLDDSWRTAPDEELFKLERAATGYWFQDEELERHGVPMHELQRLQRDLYDLILQRKIARLPEPKYTHVCVVCGEPTSMIASLGPACPDHYDELS